MTTTAFDDQFTIGTQTIEPVRQPYDTVSILKRNVADLELELKRQTERTTHKGATHCNDCGLTWLDDGLNPLRCPYCKDAVPAPAVPAEWRNDVFAAADELRSTVRDLRNGFVRCGNCGEQETTSDLDCVSDIDGALELLNGLLQSPQQSLDVPAEWRAVMVELLANDGADGCRYDANKWLAARDKARALLQSAEVKS